MSECPIPAIDEIRKEMDVPVFEVFGDLDPLDGPVIVENNDMDALKAFAKAVGAKVVLVQYDYADTSDYLIDETLYKLDTFFDSDEVSEISDNIHARNCEVMDYFQDEYEGEPVGCSIYVNYEGTAYGIYIEDEEMLDAIGETPEEFVWREIYAKMMELSEGTYDDGEDEEEDDEDDEEDEEDEEPCAFGER